jgi:cysteine desulfuration protein SufE
MPASSPPFEEISDTFEFLDDWEERYKYIIDLGKQLPPLDEAEMCDAYKVRGCQSQVWLVPMVGDDGIIHLRGDSDAFIVKGLVAVMLSLFSGKTGAEILAIDAKEILSGLGLASHLSPMRANGLFSMVERIRAIASAA